MPVITEPDPSLRRPGSAGRVHELIERSHRNNQSAGQGRGTGGNAAAAAAPARGPPALDEMDFDYVQNVAASGPFRRNQQRPRQMNSSSTRGGVRSNSELEHVLPAADSPTSSSTMLSPSSRRRSQLASVGVLGAATSGGEAAAAAAPSNNHPRNNRGQPTGSILDLRGIPGEHSSVMATWVPPQNSAALVRGRKIEQLQQTVLQLQGEVASLREEAAARNEELEAAQRARHLAEARSVQLEQDCQSTIERQHSQLQTQVAGSRAEAERYRTDLENVQRVVDFQLTPELDRKTQEMARLQDSHNGVVQMLQKKQRELEDANHSLQEKQRELEFENDKLHQQLEERDATYKVRVDELEQQNLQLMEEIHRLTAGGTDDDDDGAGGEYDDVDDKGSTKRRHDESASRRSRSPYPLDDAAQLKPRAGAGPSKSGRARAAARELQELQRSNAHYGDVFYESRQGPASMAMATATPAARTSPTSSSSGKSGSSRRRHSPKDPPTVPTQQTGTDFVLRHTDRNTRRTSSAGARTAVTASQHRSQFRRHEGGILEASALSSSPTAASQAFATPLVSSSAAAAAHRPHHHHLHNHHHPRPSGDGARSRPSHGSTSSARPHFRAPSSLHHHSTTSSGTATESLLLMALPTATTSSAFRGVAVGGTTIGVATASALAPAPTPTGNRNRLHQKIRRATRESVPMDPFDPMYPDDGDGDDADDEPLAPRKSNKRQLQQPQEPPRRTTRRIVIAESPTETDEGTDNEDDDDQYGDHYKY